LNPALLSWLLGTTTTLTLGFVTAVLMGTLVPSGRVDKAEAGQKLAEAVADVRRETNEALTRTNAVQAELIARLQVVGDIQERLVTAIKTATSTQAGGNQ
jgi:hypothetical protein